MDYQVELGQVIALVPANPYTPGAAPLVQLALQPGNRAAEGRLAVAGAGPLGGLLAPVLPGQEVLVLVPRGDTRACVVLPGLHSARAPAPPTWLGTNLRVQCATGVELRSAEGLPADGVVLGNFLAGLLAYVQSVQAFVATAAAAEPLLAPAAATFAASSAPFVTALTTSAAFVDPDSGGLGGAPFASTLVRATL